MYYIFNMEKEIHKILIDGELFTGTKDELRKNATVTAKYQETDNPIVNTIAESTEEAFEWFLKHYKE